MQAYDWIVIGGGITGAALSYELARQGLQVLLLEQHATLQGATRFSYGGLAYWAGTTAMTRQLCQEGIERHRTLSAELDADTQFRELDLLLTIAADQEPEIVATSYSHYAIAPRLLSIQEACHLEPLLNKNAIAGALSVRHGHINPALTVQGFCQALHRLGGERQIAQVLEFLSSESRIFGVKTTQGIYIAANVVVCAGGLSRTLLKTAGIAVPLYFTHAELLETPRVDVQLRTLVMPAVTQRFQLESQASSLEADRWSDPAEIPPQESSPLPNQPQELVGSSILDAGAIQFKDGSLRLGQISRLLSQPQVSIDPGQSEAMLRHQVAHVLPALGNLPSTWHHCLVAFSPDHLPLIGGLTAMAGLYMFSGFSNPLIIVPSLARRFARLAVGQEDEVIAQLSPARFTSKDEKLN
ncbi:MAG TPA: FAD-binding oxidoreductase [Candidatus Caenarcaniphilales bacterium]